MKYTQILQTVTISDFSSFCNCTLTILFVYMHVRVQKSVGDFQQGQSADGLPCDRSTLHSHANCYVWSKGVRLDGAVS